MSEIEQGEVEETTAPPENLEDNTAELEARARRQGWKPKEEYRGPPGRWRDAKTYLEHGENEWPILRERFREMEKRHVERETKSVAEIDDLKKRLTETTEVLVEMRDMTHKSTEAAYQRGKREVESRMQQAVANSDMAAYHAAQQEMTAVEAQRPAPPREIKVELPAAPPPPPAPSIDPAISAWISQNHWFERDHVLKTYATDIDADLMRRFPGMDTEDRLTEVTRQTMSKFPEKFGSPRRAAAAPVASGSPPPVGRKGKSVDDLPSDAKAALARIKVQIPGYKDDEYLKVYFAGEE